MNKGDRGINANSNPCSFFRLAETCALYALYSYDPTAWQQFPSTGLPDLPSDGLEFECIALHHLGPKELAADTRNALIALFNHIMHSSYSKTGDADGAHQDFFDLFGFTRLVLEPTQQEPGAHSASRNDPSIAAIKKTMLNKYEKAKTAALFPGLQRYYESDKYREGCIQEYQRALIPHVYRENWRQRVQRRRDCVESFAKRHAVDQTCQTFDKLIDDLKLLHLLRKRDRVKWWDNLKTEIKASARRKKPKRNSPSTPSAPPPAEEFRLRRMQKSLSPRDAAT